MLEPEHVKRAIKKAQQSQCHFKICAIGLDKDGEILGYVNNSARFSRKGGGLHAEQRLMARYQQHIKTIIIIRTNITGSLLPIDPCDMCKRKADELGIKIITLPKLKGN